MSEMTLAERLGVFFELAAEATPNSDTSRKAQTYFKSEIMGLPDDQAGDSHLLDKSLKDAFLHALGRTVGCRTEGTQMQIPETYEGLMSRLPIADRNTHRGLGHVLDKIALQCGAREPQTYMAFGK